MAWNVNNDLMRGNDVYLYITLPNSAGTIASAATNAKVVAYATSCNLQIDSDTLDVTSKLSCRWQASIAGNASYTVTADALYCLRANAAANSAYTVDDLFNAMVEGNNVGWFMGSDSSTVCGQVRGLDTTKPYYFGEGTITSLSIEAGNNDICSSSISINGSGKVKQGGI